MARNTLQAYSHMNHNATIKPANIEFQTSTDTTLLNAALANNFSLQYSCKKGSCGVCSAEVMGGCVKNENGELVNSGAVLTCSSYA